MVRADHEVVLGRIGMQALADDVIPSGMYVRVDEVIE